jgi:hypothetical protein
LGGRGGSNFAPPPARNQKQLAFEYELSSGKLALREDAPKRKPTWASISPDDKTVVFARDHNLYRRGQAAHPGAHERLHREQAAQGHQ